MNKLSIPIYLKKYDILLWAFPSDLKSSMFFYNPDKNTNFPDMDVKYIIEIELHKNHPILNENTDTILVAEAAKINLKNNMYEVYLYMQDGNFYHLGAKYKEFDTDKKLSEILK